MHATLIVTIIITVIPYSVYIFHIYVYMHPVFPYPPYVHAYTHFLKGLCTTARLVVVRGPKLLFFFDLYEDRSVVLNLF